MKPDRNGACPCGTGRKAKRCCLQSVEGAVPAADPEALLRARFCAYAWGAVDYLMATTSGAAVSRDPAWSAKLVEYCSAVSVVDLEIFESETGQDTGSVRYRARLTHHGSPFAIEEHALYARVNGRWTYSGSRETPG